MKRQNRDGAKVLGTLPELVQFTAQQIIEKTSAKEAVFVDTRGHVAVAEGTVAGALAIPAISKMASFGAWAFDPQADDRQLILFAENLESAEEMRDHLMRVGIDAVSGYATSLRGLPAFTPPRVDPTELEDFDHALLLDVRGRGEFNAGAIPDAKHISGGRACGPWTNFRPTARSSPIAKVACATRSLPAPARCRVRRGRTDRQLRRWLPP